VCVSRGNIGLDVAPEKMALVQKQLICQCNLLGKPVLITRVVDSMVTNPRPTRAEATGGILQDSQQQHTHCTRCTALNFARRMHVAKNMQTFPPCLCPTPNCEAIYSGRSSHGMILTLCVVLCYAVYVRVCRHCQCSAGRL
jgi:hypothetical protein